jgi:hypothetical protein
LRIGKLGDGADLPEHLKAREMTGDRNAPAELVFKGVFGTR